MGFFDRFNDSLSAKNNQSPFGEAGLLGDPLHYIAGAVGKGDDYDKFMRKTWEYPNKYVGEGVKKFNVLDRKVNPMHKAIDKTSIGAKARDYVENKPGDSLMAVLGAIYGGGSLMGGGGNGSGMFGSMFNGGGQQGLGVFSNGGQGGMAGVGQGNAGQLFANTGINTGGVGGVGGTGAATSPTWQQYAKAGQGLLGQQQQGQQQQQGPKPYLYKNRIVWM